ncbi:MAG: hypothetical protein HG467_002820 [Clostridiales bacterium]|nr:hypothetical protein [Clostridiales bacterium]
MKKKSLKILLSILLVMAFLMPMAFAASGQIQGNTVDVRELQPSANNEEVSKQNMIKLTRKVLEILQLIGIAVGLVMIVIIGIKSIISAGGKDRPDIKNVVIDYVFGAICIFGATGILTSIQQLVAQFQNNL